MQGDILEKLDFRIVLEPFFPDERLHPPNRRLFVPDIFEDSSGGFRMRARFFGAPLPVALHVRREGVLRGIDQRRMCWQRTASLSGSEASGASEFSQALMRRA